MIFFLIDFPGLRVYQDQTRRSGTQVRIIRSYATDALHLESHESSTRRDADFVAVVANGNTCLGTLFRMYLPDSTEPLDIEEKPENA